MIVLNTTSDIIQVTTTSANALDVHCTYVDNVTAAPYTSARQNTAIVAATTTTVLSSPAASTQRQLKVLTAVAKGGANNVAPKLFDGSTTFNLFGNGIPLLANETLAYEDARGWFVLDATGQVKQVGATGPTGPTGITGTAGSPGADGEDAPDPMMIPGPQGLTGVTGPQGAPGIAAFPGSDPEEPDAAWIALPPTTSPAIVPPSRLPIQLQSLDLWGHSYLDDPLTGQTIGSLATNDANNFGYLYAAAAGIERGNVRNHAVSGSYLTNIGYGGANGAGGNFPKFLVELTDPKTQTLPFTRMGGAHLICTGSNDIGANTAANQALTRATAQDILIYIISRMRASAWYSAQSATNQAFGANWTNAAATAIDWTSGLAKVCSTVDSAGTSTVTFTIPYGYKGEPICFGISSQSSATSMQITWGGNITGTSGIIGTVSTLSSRSVNANGIVGFRWTGPTNGISAANAGQTITFKLSAVTAQSCWYDGVVIEAFKPAAVLICNQPRLPQKTFNLALGDGVTTGVNTSFTSANGGQFATTGGWRQLAGAPITETDAQGAFTGSANTVGSVTNATTLVLGSNAAAAKTSIQCTVQTTIFGYNSGLYSPLATNTNWFNATTASHSAADTDVTNWNAMIATVAALFDSMVQVVDMDGAIGSDTNVPSTAYSFFCTDGYHPNNLGQQYVAQAVWTAAQKLAAPASDVQNIGVMQVQASPSYVYAPDRQIISSGQVYLPQFGAWNATNYTAAAGDLFAFPIMVTEPTAFWGAFQVEQINNPVTSGSSVRVGWYDDPNGLGYPQSLRVEPTLGAAVALGTTLGVKSLGSISRPVHTGLHWIVFKIDTLGTTASVLRAISGPCKHMPSWISGGGATSPMGWKVLAVASGILPSKFPSGALVTSTLPYPAVGITVTTQ